MQNFANGFYIHLINFAIDQSVKSSAYAVYLHTFVHSGSDHCPMAAFMPGASPPLVKTPIFFMLFLPANKNS
jgi:hypothetical protein